MTTDVVATSIEDILNPTHGQRPPSRLNTGRGSYLFDLQDSPERGRDADNDRRTMRPRSDLYGD